jgi:hypothetical protein
MTGLYRPLLIFLFALLWNAGLHVPFWFHLLAVGAHAIATLLVWELLKRGVPRWCATLGALWFAVQPLHIEAVANISNSSEVFVTIATLSLTLVLLRAGSTTPEGPVPWRTAVAAGALFAAALLFKESGLMSPVLALLVVWGWNASLNARPIGLFRSVIVRQWQRWYRLVVVCVLAFGVVLVARVNALGSIVSHRSIAAEGLDSLTAVQRVWAMLALGPKIVGLLLWPTILNPAYGPRFVEGHSGVSAPAVAFIVLSTAVVLAAVVLARRGDRRLVTGLAFAAIAFLPASNLLMPTGQTLAERTLYLPSVGITLLLSALLSRSVAAIQSAMPSMRERLPTLAGAAAAVLALVAAANATRHRSWVWHDHDAWFHQVIAANPNYFRAYLEFALYQRMRGQRHEALANLQHAYALAPGEQRVRVELTTELLASGDPARAAGVATELMSSPEGRHSASDVALYFESVGAAFGPDSVLVAADRLRADAPAGITAIYSGRAHEARGERMEALRVYRDGLASAGTDSTVAAWLRQRVDSVSR